MQQPYSGLPEYIKLYEGTHTLSGDACTFTTNKILVAPLCPDLLQYDDIGAADNLRGRVVRTFFWLMRWWKV